MVRTPRNLSSSPPNMMSPLALLSRDVVKHLNFSDCSLDEPDTSIHGKDIVETKNEGSASYEEHAFSTPANGNRVPVPTSAFESSLRKERPNFFSQSFIANDGSILKYLNGPCSRTGKALLFNQDTPQGNFGLRDDLESPCASALPKKFLKFDNDSVDSECRDSVQEESLTKSVENQQTSKAFPEVNILPTTKGPHRDIPYISSRTMVGVLRGKYKAQLTIVDCRCPSAYEEGHIKFAENFYIKGSLSDKFFGETAFTESNRSHIVIFYCEFSTVQAPNTYRSFREKYREMMTHPGGELFYPEMYILKGGYKAFFENHKDMCYPQSYKSMTDISLFRGEIRRDEQNRIRWRMRL